MQLNNCLIVVRPTITIVLCWHATKCTAILESNGCQLLQLPETHSNQKTKNHIVIFCTLLNTKLKLLVCQRRRGLFTSMVLINLHDNISQTLDGNQFCAGNFLDLMKAFDTVEYRPNDFAKQALILRNMRTPT